MAFGKPKTPLTPEQQLQRRQNIGVGLAALSESLRGGDPVSRTLGLMEQFEQKDLDKQLDDAIDMSNLPESQKKLIKSLSVQAKTQALMQAYQPPKTLSPSEQKARILAKVQAGETLSKEDIKILDILQRTDPIEIAMRGALGTTDIATDVNIPEINTKEEYDKLPLGSEYISGGIKYKKGE